MAGDSIKKNVTENIAALKKAGVLPVIVHGGGPVIQETLRTAQIESKFVEGHRVTGAKAMQYIEMALTGRVNGDLTALLNKAGAEAVGISGKDASTVIAKKRYPQTQEQKTDLGFVGDVDEVNPALIYTLLNKNFVPVISPVSSDKDGNTYNINADMLAGHVARVLNAEHYVVLTDVDGLMRDKKDPSTLIKSITAEKAANETGNIIQGGMIPKVNSCLIALNGGVKATHIINGMEENCLLEELLTKKRKGTLITL